MAGVEIEQSPNNSVEETVKLPGDDTPTIHVEPDVKFSTETSTNIGKDGNDDAYAYTQREGFTSEIFKIELKNLSRNISPAQLKKFVTSRDLKPKKVKLIKFEFEDKAFVTFSCEEDRVKAIEILNGYTWKGRQLQVKKAAPKADPVSLKRKLDEKSGQLSAKHARYEEEDIDPEEKLKNSVTPLWKMAYEDQLKLKYDGMADVLRKLCKQIERNNQDLFKWYLLQKKQYSGMCCPLEPVMASPILEGYRNKCEFTIGRSLDGEDRVVGFRYGKYRGGCSSVGEPDCCRNVPRVMLGVVKRLQEFIRASPHDVFEPQTQSGHWRMLTLRTSVTGQVMAMIEFHPQALTQVEIDAVKSELTEYFRLHGDGEVTSLYFHINNEKTTSTNDVTPYELILGEPQMTETLSGLKFRISPLAFFQVNTPAAELLYDRVGDLCDATGNSTVLDVCCGTGTIGLTLAKRVKKVIGVEMVQAAIDDAKINAQFNGVENAEYRCGKAEDILPCLMDRIHTDNLSAIVDPPRAGLHTKVLQAIRRCRQLRSLVYVSCNPNAAMNNFVDLCRSESKRIRGDPFVPVKAVCVDLFPDTPHCELIVLFERYDAAKHLSAVTDKNQRDQS